MATRARTFVADTGLAALVLAAFLVELWASDDIGPDDRPWTAIALLSLEAVVLVPRVSGAAPAGRPATGGRSRGPRR